MYRSYRVEYDDDDNNNTKDNRPPFTVPLTVGSPGVGVTGREIKRVRRPVSRVAIFCTATIIIIIVVVEKG